MGPDLSFEADSILFAWCQHHPGLADEQNKADKARVPESAFYHVFEMKVDGSARRQLTDDEVRILVQSAALLDIAWKRF